MPLWGPPSLELSFGQALVIGEQVAVQATAHPALLKTPSEMILITADLSAVGGPVALPFAAMADGTYRFEVLAQDGNGDPITTDTSIVARITGVRFFDGIVLLQIGGRDYTLSELRAISEEPFGSTGEIGGDDGTDGSDDIDGDPIDPADESGN